MSRDRDGVRLLCRLLTLTIPLVGLVSINACSLEGERVGENATALDVPATDDPPPPAVPSNPNAPSIDRPIIELPKDYGQRLQADLAEWKAKQADPMPFLTRLASHKDTSLTSAVVVVYMTDTSSASITVDVAEVTFQVDRVIAGASVGASLTVLSEGYDASVNWGGTLFQPHVGARYALLLQPADQPGKYVLVERDNSRGWFREVQPGIFRIDRGPTVTEAQLTSLVTGVTP